MADDLAVLEAGLEKKEEPAAKRAKLKPYDLLPSQVLNAMGESGIQTTSLKQLADVQARGNKAAAYFTELCDENLGRKHIAVSRLSDVQLQTGEKILKTNYYKKYIDSKLYDPAMREFEELRPSFKTLLGKDVWTADGGQSVSSIIYSGISETKNKTEVNAAAKRVYDWLQKKESKWRQLQVLLSSGGLFYVASVHERSHRAYIAHGEKEPVTVEAYQKWCCDRLCGEGAPAALNDLEGL